MKSGRQKLKKYLAFVMTVVMVLTAVPFGGLTFSAIAEDGEYTEGYYTYTVENGEATITGCDNSISGEVVIPDTLGGYPVTSIGYEAFCNCTGLTSITIPNSVTSIGDSAFSDCTGLTSITIPDSVTSIGEYAFAWCESLTSITIPDSVTSIGEYAFYDCAGLTSITIPDSVTSIGCYAYYNTSYYNNDSNWENDVLYIGNHLIKAKDSFSGDYDIKGVTKTIADNAFLYCTGLTSITIPDSVTSIGNYAFSGCAGLTSITIPNGVTSIGDGAFAYCSGLTSITIPDSVTSIGCDAYYNTSYYNNDSNWENDVLYIGNHLIKAKTSISGVYSIKDGTKTIAESAFEDCTGLTSITIPDSVTSIGDLAFYYCTGITSVTIGNSVTSIGEAAFGNCTRLTSITIPDSVTSIGNYAFSGCAGLTSITVSTGNTVYHSTDNCLIETESKTLIFGCKNSVIPTDGSVTSIGEAAFVGCTGLTSITIPDSVTSIGDVAFAICTDLTSITIPDSVTDIGNKAFGYYFDESTYEVKKLDNFTIYGYTGTAAETYANENGFAFIALDEEHTHTYSAWAVITEPTCTAEGEETRTCSVCGAEETRPVERKAHDLNNVKIDSTCTVAGVSYDVCSECQQTFNYVTLPLAAHTFGEWTVTKEATAFEFGEKVRICSVCGFEEKEKIEKLPVSEVKDEKTGISVVCPDGSYDGEVEIEVSEVFDGTSYNILNAEKGNFKNALFDITTVIDGEKVQPNGSVFVKIPLPDGYNAEKTVVYYITNDGKLEKMDSRVEDGYIIFETTHFSFYAIVDETEPENPSANCSCACHKKGIAKLFFKIKLFFQKIFKKNKVCSCGVNHY